MISGSYSFSQKIFVFLAPRPLLPLPSPPRFRNPILEQTIAGKQDGTELYLSFETLTDEDMEIVAYYAISNNTVRYIEYVTVPIFWYPKEVIFIIIFANFSVELKKIR